jgi:hypothetical protein
MCLRQNHELKHREPKPERTEDETENPLRQMREPPGALGDIVRRMKRREALLCNARPSSLLNDGRRNTG